MCYILYRNSLNSMDYFVLGWILQPRCNREYRLYTLVYNKNISININDEVRIYPPRLSAVRKRTPQSLYIKILYQNGICKLLLSNKEQKNLKINFYSLIFFITLFYHQWYTHTQNMYQSNGHPFNL